MAGPAGIFQKPTTALFTGKIQILIHSITYGEITADMTLRQNKLGNGESNILCAEDSEEIYTTGNNTIRNTPVFNIAFVFLRCLMFSTNSKGHIGTVSCKYSSITTTKPCRPRSIASKLVIPLPTLPSGRAIPFD